MHQITIVAGRLLGHEPQFLAMLGAVREGRMPGAQFAAAVGDSQIRDAQGVVWTLDGRAGAWLWWNGTHWHQGLPPFLAAPAAAQAPQHASPLPPRPAAPATYAPADPVATSPAAAGAPAAAPRSRRGFVIAAVVGVVVVAGIVVALVGSRDSSEVGESGPTPPSGDAAPAPKEPAVKPTMSLHQAATTGDLAQLEARLKSGSSANSRGPGGLTPLQTAIMSDQPQTAEMLLRYKADPKVKDLLGQSAIELAIQGDDAGTVQALLDAPGAVAASGTDVAGLLRMAARVGAPNVAQLLLRRGVAPDAADAGRSTPMHLAARRGHANVVGVLLASGANANAADGSGATPLHVAARANRADVLALLLAKGADVRAKDAAGHTALDLAAVAAGPDVIRALLGKGADAGAQGPEGTPLAVALANGNLLGHRAMSGPAGE